MPQSRYWWRGRAQILGVALLACASLAVVQFVPPRPFLVWNASASLPVGLYWLEDGRDLKRGDLVLVWLPQAARKLAAERAYLPSDTPAAKRVAALAGDRVCVENGIVRINHRTVAKALPTDQVGRPLEAWRGCVVLGSNQIFLLAAGAVASFDGRYIGPSERRDIIGRLVPLWTF